MICDYNEGLSWTVQYKVCVCGEFPPSITIQTVNPQPFNQQLKEDKDYKDIFFQSLVEIQGVVYRPSGEILDILFPMLEEVYKLIKCSLITFFYHQSSCLRFLQ